VRGEDPENARQRQGRPEPALFYSKRPPDPARLRGDDVVDAVASLARDSGLSLFLVGGAIRDLVLSRPLGPDYDFVADVRGDASRLEAFSARVAERLGGTSFVLDKKTPLYRVALKGRPHRASVDLSPVMGAEIAEDLRARDFTVNAMAMDTALLWSGEASVTDPCGGLEDASLGLLRMTSPDVFERDPLRCLRGVRLSVGYGLTLEADTVRAMRAGAALLSRTSRERIRDELTAIFEAEDARAGLAALFDLKIVDTIAPEIKGWEDIGGYGLLSHSLAVVDEAAGLVRAILEDGLPGLPAGVRERYSSRTGAVSNAALLKMAAFFHDAGKAATISRASGRLRFKGHDALGAGLAREMLLRLRFSRRTAGDVARLVGNHHRVFTLAALERPSYRARAHFFRAVHGAPGVDLLLLALADARATCASPAPALLSLVTDMLGFYYGVYSVEKPPPLLGGAEIMDTFGMAEGPLVGEIMEKVAEWIEEGRVSERAEALVLVREWLEERKKA